MGRHRIQVLADAVSTKLAEGMVAEFEMSGSAVALTLLERFPVADALPDLLLRSTRNADLVVVVVAKASPHREWVFSELRHTELHPNVLLAVEDRAALPEWASADSGRVVIPGQTLRVVDTQSVVNPVREDSDPRSSRLRVGQPVSVVLNERNRTPHRGTVARAIWHHKLNRWHYFLEENGKAISKRYSADDLVALRDETDG